MVRRNNRRSLGINSHSLIFGFAAGCWVVSASLGCTLSPEINDEYPAYGGIFQRMDQREGRVGSVLSDPNLMGNVVVSSTDGDVYDEAIATEESTIDAIVSEELIQENTFWRGRTTETVEVIEEDAEITFEEEIQ